MDDTTERPAASSTGWSFARRLKGTSLLRSESKITSRLLGASEKNMIHSIWFLNYYFLSAVDLISIFISCQHHRRPPAPPSPPALFPAFCACSCFILTFKLSSPLTLLHALFPISLVWRHQSISGVTKRSPEALSFAHRPMVSFLLPVKKQQIVVFISVRPALYDVLQCYKK